MFPAPLPWWKKLLRRPKPNISRAALCRFSKTRASTRLEFEILERRLCMSGTLLTATPLTFNNYQSVQVSDYLAQPDEVDFYRISLATNERITASVSAQTAGSGLQSLLRIFDANGAQLAFDDQIGGDPQLTFQATTAGDYFIGVSSAPNNNYDPNLAATGAKGGTTGVYTLSIGSAARPTHIVTISPFAIVSLTNSIAVADINGDGPPDIVTADYGPSGVTASVQLGRSENMLPVPVSGQFKSFLPLLIDVNDDTMLDLVILAPNDVVHVQLGDGAGAFEPHHQVLLGSDSKFMAVADVSGDGSPDLIVTYEDKETARVFRGHGDGTFGDPEFVDLRLIPEFMTAADINGDGKKDLVVAGYDFHLDKRVVRVRLRNGEGGFQNAKDSPLDAGPQPKMVVAEVTGDRNLDIIAETAGDTVSLLVGKGDGAFKAQQTNEKKPSPIQTESRPIALAASDVTGDALPDLVVANTFVSEFAQDVDPESDPYRIGILAGTGGGTFKSEDTLSLIPIRLGEKFVVPVDVDGDGLDDVVVSYNRVVATHPAPAIVAAADVTGSSFRLGTATAAWGDTVPVILTIENRGALAADATAQVQILLSDNNAFHSASKLLELSDTISLAGLAPGRPFHSGPLMVNLPDAATALALGFSTSGPLFLGIRITDDPAQDAGHHDKAGVHRGKDWEAVTIVTPATPDVSDLSAIDAKLNTRTSGTLSDPGQVNTFTFRVSAELGSGRLTAKVVASAGTLVPRLTLTGSDAANLVQSEGGTISIGLTPGDGEYSLVVSARSGVGSYQLITEFIPTTSQTTPPSGISSDPTAVADFNADGRLDLVTAAYSASTVRVLLGNGDGSYQESQSIPGSAGQTSVVVADVDGDGRLDIFVGSTEPVATENVEGDGKPPKTITANRVTVFLGNGDGTFQAGLAFEISAVPMSLTVADVNMDRLPDIVTQGGILSNLGAGTFIFRDVPDFATGNLLPGTVTADVNRDGVPDVVTAAFPSPDKKTKGFVAHLLLGNGDGTFQSTKDLPGLLPGQSVVVMVADVDRDQWPDIILADQAASIRVLLNSGSATVTFQQKSLIDLSDGVQFNYGGFQSMATADVDGDGRLDIVTANRDSGAQIVLLGNGDGTFHICPTVPTAMPPTSLVVADVDGDGLVDSVTAQGTQVNVRLGSGDGAFQSSRAFAVGPRPTSVAVIDINGDNRLDIVTSNSGDRTVSVMLGNGEGTFQPQQTFKVSGRKATSVAVADLNGDGRPEIVSTVIGSLFDYSILLANGDGTFQPGERGFLKPKSTQDLQNPVAVAVADIDGDGKPDLVFANFGNDDPSNPTVTQVLSGRAAGHRELFGNILVEDYLRKNFPEVFQFPVFSQQLVEILGRNIEEVLEEKFPGFFEFPAFSQHLNQKRVDVNAPPVSVAVADLDKDRKPDIVTAIPEENAVGIQFGNGIRGTIPVGEGPQSVAIADLDGNGWLDLATANYLQGDDGTEVASISVRLGTGTGHFTPDLGFSVPGQPSAISVADVDNDGLPDLVTTDRSDDGGDSVNVWLGSGSGAFSRYPLTFPVGADPRSVAIADVNGDGRPDIITANGGDGSVSVLLNRGDGTFSSSSAVSGVGFRNTPYLMDLNHDQIQDSVILTRSGTILFRKGLSKDDSRFGSPDPLNDQVPNTATGRPELRPARDMTIVKTAHGNVIATADVLPNADQLFTISLYLMAIAESAPPTGPFQNGMPADDSASPTLAFRTPFLPTRIVAGDLNGDCLDDLVVASSLDNTIQIAFQKCDGTFELKFGREVGLAPSDITFAKINGDNLIDIVVSNQASGTVSVLLNNPTHTFSEVDVFRSGAGLSVVTAGITGTALDSLDQSVSLAVGAFTAVGAKDLLVVNRGAHSFTVLPNTSGAFPDPGTALTTSTSSGFLINNRPGAVVVADFHALDGLNDYRTAQTDVAILMEDRSEVWIYTNNGDGTFNRGQRILVGELSTGLAVIPGRTDGLFDLLVGNEFGDILRLVGQGDGTFASLAPPKGSTVSIDVQTLPGGARAVLVANQATSGINVQKPAEGGKTFMTTQTLADDPTSELAPGDVQWAKLDTNGGDVSDPYFDAVVIATGANRVLIYHTSKVDPRTGTPTFDEPISYPVGNEPVAVTVEDVNRDAVPDLLVANKGSNDVSVLFGQLVDNIWTATAGPRLQSRGSAPIATALRDFNGDQFPDLVVTNSGSGASGGTLTVLPGRGQGFFDDRPDSVKTFPAGTSLLQSVAEENIFGSFQPIFMVGGDGSIRAFDGQGLTTAFNSAAKEVSLIGINNSSLVAAFTNGDLAILQQDASGRLEVTANDVDSFFNNFSALEVLRGLNGLEIYLTLQGSGVPIVLTPADFVPVADFQTRETLIGEATSLPDAVLALIPTVVIVPFTEIVNTGTPADLSGAAFVPPDFSAPPEQQANQAKTDDLDAPHENDVPVGGREGVITSADRFRIGLEEAIQRLLEQWQAELRGESPPNDDSDPPQPEPMPPTDTDPAVSFHMVECRAPTQVQADNAIEAPPIAQDCLQVETALHGAGADETSPLKSSAPRWEVLLGAVKFLAFASAPRTEVWRRVKKKLVSNWWS